MNEPNIYITRVVIGICAVFLLCLPFLSAKKSKLFSKQFMENVFEEEKFFSCRCSHFKNLVYFYFDIAAAVSLEKDVLEHLMIQLVHCVHSSFNEKKSSYEKSITQQGVSFGCLGYPAPGPRPPKNFKLAQPPPT